MNNTPIADEPHGREEDYELDVAALAALALELPPLESYEDYRDEESEDDLIRSETYHYKDGVLCFIDFGGCSLEIWGPESK